jgi:CRISPR-associated endonuclease Csn1
MQNKVICLSKENQDKKNLTPFEYFTQANKDWHWFEEFVRGLKNIKKAKRDRLLKKNFDENSEIAFRERNANDTAYMAKFIKDFLEDNLDLTSKDKQKVLTRSGTLTSMLRHNWGIGDKSRDNHLHHAVDALIVAFTTQSEVQRLSTLSAKKDGFIYEKSEKKAGQLKFLPPMEHFRDKVQKSIDEIFVSFAPRRGVNGAAHKETIYSKNAEKIRGTFEINNGLAENGEVKRIDVFIKDNKYHFIFLYPTDFLKKELPNISIKNIQIDNSFEFLFSLFKDEYIEIKQKNGNPFFGYLKFVESDGRFNILPHSQAELDKKNNRFSTGSLEYIKKYQVDPLGNISEIKKEQKVGTKKQR